MTYSIVARDPATGEFGIAVASRFFAVGAIVPYLRAGAGAIATQAFISPLYGIDGIKLLAGGLPAADVLQQVIMGDDGRHSRQLHMIDKDGRIAAFTGEKCVDWAGHAAAENVSVAGNMLAGPQVIEATLEAYLGAEALPFAERLLSAMEAGEKAGGDKRGRQSAALRIVAGEPYPRVDIRADDHSDPLCELRRLLSVAAERYFIFAKALPTRGNPNGTIDRAPIDAEMAKAEAARIAEGRPSASFAVAR